MKTQRWSKAELERFTSINLERRKHGRLKQIKERWGKWLKEVPECPQCKGRGENIPPHLFDDFVWWRGSKVLVCFCCKGSGKA